MRDTLKNMRQLKNKTARRNQLTAYFQLQVISNSYFDFIVVK